MKTRTKGMQAAAAAATTSASDTGVAAPTDVAGVHQPTRPPVTYGSQPITKSGGFIKVTTGTLMAVNESARTRRYSGMVLEANGRVSQPLKNSNDSTTTIAAVARSSILHGALMAAATEYSIIKETGGTRPSARQQRALPINTHAAVLSAFLGGGYSRGRVSRSRGGYRPTYRQGYRHVVGLLKSEEERANADIRAIHPDYGSLVTQIHEVNKEADSDVEFLCKSYKILHNTAVMSVVLFVLLAIPISMVAFGVNELPGCPKEPFIPIYLLVGGCVGILKLLNVIWRQLRTRYFFETPDALGGIPPDRETFASRKSTLCTDVIISVFLFIWFILGNYWTWKHWKPKFVMTLHEPGDWCGRTLYLFTVGQIVACYIIMAAVLLLLASLCCCRQVCCYHDRIPKRVVV